MAVTWQASLFGTGEPAIDDVFAGIRRVALDDTAWVDHLAGWLDGADQVMDELLSTAPWRAATRPMYDRIVAVPRLTAWYGWDPVAGLVGAPPILEAIRRALSRRYEVTFTSCGCNLYRDGRDSVAWHGDRIRADVLDPRVAIVSVGEPRKLLLRPRAGGASVGFRLGDGDLLVMGGSSQRTWQHAVPKAASAGPRMSITFRHGMMPLPDGYDASMAGSDPRKEPENSTVDDWHGQKVARDAEQADRLQREAEAGLEDEAEETRAEAAFNDRTKD